MLARSPRKYAKRSGNVGMKRIHATSRNAPEDIRNGTYRVIAYSTSMVPVNFSLWGGVYGKIENKWDLVIAHPPCTDLAISGARWFPEKQKDFRQQKSCVFFMQMMLNTADRVAVENPIGIMSSCYRKPDQIIQPYEYGHPYTKKTCLWLKGLPNLQPTDVVEPLGGWVCGNAEIWKKQAAKGKVYGKEKSAKHRSKTFEGIAKAMATQWSEYLTKED